MWLKLCVATSTGHNPSKVRVKDRSKALHIAAAQQADRGGLSKKNDATISVSTYSAEEFERWRPRLHEKRVPDKYHLSVRRRGFAEPSLTETMAFFLYFFGLPLAVGLPLLMMVISAVLGFVIDRSASAQFRALTFIGVGSAIAVPTAAKFGTGDIPAPWWLAIFMGDFDFQFRLLFVLVGLCLLIFLLGTLARAGVSALGFQLRGNKEH